MHCAWADCSDLGWTGCARPGAGSLGGGALGLTLTCDHNIGRQHLQLPHTYSHNGHWICGYGGQWEFSGSDRSPRSGDLRPSLNFIFLAQTFKLVSVSDRLCTTNCTLYTLSHINLNSKVDLESTLRIFIVLYHILNKNCPFTFLHLPLDTNQPSYVTQHFPPALPGPGIQTPDSDLFALILILFCTQFYFGKIE